MLLTPSILYVGNIDSVEIPTVGANGMVVIGKGLYHTLIAWRTS